MTKVFTVAGIDKIKPDPAKRREIPDGLLCGLYFVIQPSGARSWAVRYRHAGRTRKFTIGGYPEFSLKDARDQARDVLQSIAKDADPAELKRERRIELRNEANLLPNVVTQFLERHIKRKCSARHAGETERIFVTAVYPVLGRQRIQDVTKADILNLVNGIADNGTPILANRVLAAVRRLFNWCMEQDLLDTTPCGGIKAPGLERPRDRILTDDEVRWFWRACVHAGYPFGPCGKLLLLTGQRLNEVAQVSRKEMKGDLWTIPSARTKNNKPHEVPLSDLALTVFADCPHIRNPQSFVFTTTGQTAVGGFSKAKTRIDGLMLAEMPSDNVEIPHWRFHDLRRTVASGLAKLGVALPVIEKVLNHTSGSFGGIVSVYQHHSFAKEKREALDLWSAHIGQLTESDT